MGDMPEGLTEEQAEEMRVALEEGTVLVELDDPLWEGLWSMSDILERFDDPVKFGPPPGKSLIIKALAKNRALNMDTIAALRAELAERDKEVERLKQELVAAECAIHDCATKLGDKLERERDAHKSMIRNFEKADSLLDAALDEVEALREALEFYADRESWIYDVQEDISHLMGKHAIATTSLALQDGGAMAREALNPAERGEEEKE